MKNGPDFISVQKRVKIARTQKIEVGFFTKSLRIFVIISSEENFIFMIDFEIKENF